MDYIKTKLLEHMDTDFLETHLHNRILDCIQKAFQHDTKVTSCFKFDNASETRENTGEPLYEFYWQDTLPPNTADDVSEQLQKIDNFLTWVIWGSVALSAFLLLGMVFRFFFFYDPKEEAKRNQDMAVRTIEREILTCEKEDREEVKKRLLEAVERIDVTKELKDPVFSKPEEWLYAKAMTFQPACKAWGEKFGAKIKVERKAAVDEITRLTNTMGLIEVSARAGRENVSEGKTEIPKERAVDTKWEIVSKDEKNNVVDLTEEEWKTVKEGREKNDKVSKKGWLFFKGEESNVAKLSDEEWKIVKEAREQQKRREKKKFLVDGVFLLTFIPISIAFLVGISYPFY
ncbi:hypothetical protein N431DRAFT_511315 [Stipitochalara longipes BDJ]|nr:hypothetical protein N431DRAFT_511315 [Stipitochalara longipes BDJ]